MTDNNSFKKFKEKVRIEKCNGKIEEYKLAEYISNYNRKQKRFSIYINNHIITIVDKITQHETKIAYADNKIDAMLTAMLHVIKNANMRFGEFRWM